MCQMKLIYDLPHMPTLIFYHISAVFIGQQSPSHEKTCPTYWEFIHEIPAHLLCKESVYASQLHYLRQL